MMRQFAGLVCFFFLGFLVFVHPAITHAQKNAGIEINPAFTEVVLSKPDEEKKISITIENHYDIPITLRTFPIDFKQAGNMGQIEFIGQNAGGYSYSLASFLSFETNVINLEGKEKKEYVITAKNREDLSPGGHYAALVVQQLSDSAGNGGPMVNSALSSLIFLRKVGGEQFNLSLTEASWPKEVVVFSYPQTIELLFQNEGNVHMVPYGRVEILDGFNRVLYSGIINTSSQRVFPESRRYITADMQQVGVSLPFIFGSVRVRGEDSLHKTSFVYTAPFLYINPLFVLTIGFGFGGAVFIFRRRKNVA